MKVACRCLPAGAETGVGGDWYDVIPLSGARVALVAGHGIHVAATTGRLRTAARTLADILVGGQAPRGSCPTDEAAAYGPRLWNR